MRSGLLYPVLGVGWSTIASLATAGGTLVLAIATFASVRSANRAARVSEIALQEQRRPLLVQSRAQDPEQKIMFADGRWLRARGGGGAAEHADGSVYLTLSLRNVGAGIAVLQSWVAGAGLRTSRTHRAPEQAFRAQMRDLYIPSGDVGLWQGAIRDAGDPAHRELADAVMQRNPIWLELLYSDQTGGQRTISRFTLIPAGERDWIAGVTRHWYLDREGPR